MSQMEYTRMLSFQGTRSDELANTETLSRLKTIDLGSLISDNSPQPSQQI
jgi:hypothetical protein